MNKFNNKSLNLRFNLMDDIEKNKSLIYQQYIVNITVAHLKFLI